MRDNRATLGHLFETGQIDIGCGSIFDTPPDPPAQPVDWDRVRGMMLGLAVGDALGRARYGEIRHYRPNRHAGGRRIRPPPRWLVDLTGQVDGGDDGRACRLLDAAERLWGPEEKA